MMEELFYEQIPLTQAMGVRVVACDKKELILTAPLAPNHNHLGTAFGGSLSALATLAGYGFLWSWLGDHQLHIVIRESSIRYVRPVRGEIRAICHAPADEDLSRFNAALAEKGRARIQLDVRIVADDDVCVEFTGEYVAIC
jgi:thioesterase domain-containing protein